MSADPGPEQTPGEPDSPSSAVDRALDLLGAVVESDGPMSLAQAAGRTGLSKPTAHRILQKLVARGLVRQEPDRTYRVGPEAYALAGKTLGQLEYAREAQVGMNWLQGVTPEAIHFAALNGDVLVYVAKIEGSRPYRMASRVGAPLIMHCTSIGKSVLANFSPDRLDRYLATARLTERTPHTLTAALDLRAQLHEIAERGYAIDDEENEENIRCVGAPVFGAHGDVIGGLSVSAPTFQLSYDDAMALGPFVAKAADMVSVALGAPAHRRSGPAAVEGRVVRTSS